MNIPIQVAWTSLYFRDKAIRFMFLKGRPWFALKDVHRALDLTTRHLNRAKLTLGETEVIVDVTCVCESGLWTLVHAADPLVTREFKHWMEEVGLPAIRLCQSALAEQYAETASILKALEERLNQAVAAHDFPPRYYSILGYCQQRDLPAPHISEELRLRRIAALVSREKGYRIDSAQEGEHGRVAVYHEEVLREVFSRAASLLIE